jgi:flagellar hook protein FlgE
MSFSQAVSGLNAASSNLNVIGNNIANSATDGFKASSASFADMYAGSQIGMGVSVSGVTQNFTDGTATTTNRTLDLALSGTGFFRMEDTSGNIYYTRNGQFSLNSDSALVNAEGMQVTGYPATGTPPSIAKGAQPVALSIPSTMMSASATTTGTMVANLDSTDTVPTTTPFSSTDSSTYNYVNTITTYDSLGNSHNNNVYFVKTASNNWDVYSKDSSVTGSTASKIGSLAFNSDGTLQSATDAGGSTAANTLTLSMDVASNGATTPETVALSFAGSTQQNSGGDSIGSLTQNGYAAGQMTGYKINSDGTIEGEYSNQKTQVLGQIVLSSFANPEGLQAESNNVWAETAASGQPINGVAGTGSFASMTSGALEASNVDLGQELVNMIVAQRNYQANAQTIKTQDEVMSTLVNLR